MDVAADSHADGTGKSLENALYLVVLVLAFGLDIEVHAGSIREALEEMKEHLGGHLPHPFAVELSIPDKPGTASKVKGDGAEAVIHGEGVGGRSNGGAVAYAERAGGGGGTRRTGGGG